MKRGYGEDVVKIERLNGGGGGGGGESSYGEPGLAGC